MNIKTRMIIQNKRRKDKSYSPFTQTLSYSTYCRLTKQQEQQHITESEWNLYNLFAKSHSLDSMAIEYINSTPLEERITNTTDFVII